MKASGIKMEIHIHYFTGSLCGNAHRQDLNVTRKILFMKAKHKKIRMTNKHSEEWLHIKY